MKNQPSLEKRARPKSVRKAAPCQRRNVPGGAHPQPSPACSPPSAFRAAAKQLSELLPTAAQRLSALPPTAAQRLSALLPAAAQRFSALPPNGRPTAFRAVCGTADSTLSDTANDTVNGTALPRFSKGLQPIRDTANDTDCDTDCGTNHSTLLYK